MASGVDVVRGDVLLRMSFCTVPAAAPGTPCSSPHHVHREQDRRSGVDRHRGRDLSSGISRKRSWRSSTVSMATPTLPISPPPWVVRVVAHLGREIERGERPLCRRPGGDGSGDWSPRRCRSGVLAHRPQPLDVHRRVDAASERKPPRSPRSATDLPPSQPDRAPASFRRSCGRCRGRRLRLAHRAKRVGDVPHVFADR